MKKTWFDQPIPEVIEQFTTDIDLGLSSAEAFETLGSARTEQIARDQRYFSLDTLLGPIQDKQENYRAAAA